MKYIYLLLLLLLLIILSDLGHGMVIIEDRVIIQAALLIETITQYILQYYYSNLKVVLCNRYVI